MNDELSPEFLRFSEMLDQDPMPEAENEEQESLLLLRRVLAEDGELAASSEFAAETAEMARKRFSELSFGRRWLERSRAHLLEGAFSKRGLRATLPLLATTIGVGFFDLSLLSNLGGIIALACLLWAFWQVLDHQGLFVPSSGQNSNSTKLSFYLFPVLSAVMSGVWFAVVVRGLGTLDQYLRRGFLLPALSILVGFGVMALLVKAFSGVWKAVEQRSRESALTLWLLQSFHACWLAGGVTSLMILATGTIYNYEEPPFQDMRLAFLCSFAIAVLGATMTSFRVHFASSFTDSPYPYRKALKTLCSALLLGGLPLAGVFYGFYQGHLTKEIVDPSYEFIMREESARAKAELAIPQEKNGWFALRPYFLEGQERNVTDAAIGERLFAFGGGRISKRMSVGQFRREMPQLYSKRKQEFLSELPRIKAALDRPEYSYLADESLTNETRERILKQHRAVSRGIQHLALDDLALSRSNSALDYIVLNLRWAAKEEANSLIQWMSQLALYWNALNGLERALLEDKFDSEQLQQLELALKSYGPRADGFAQSTRRKLYFADRAFRNLANSDSDIEFPGQRGLSPWILRYLPSSYWESERKAFWNFTLPTMVDLRQLNLVGVEEWNYDRERIHWNIGTMMLAPNKARALTRHCYVRSRFSALRLQVALERYKLQQGSYPESLDSLLPEFLDSLPEDAMDRPRVGKKSGFHFQKTEKGYLLESHSTAYELLDLSDVQTYGYDDDFGEKRAAELSPK